MTSVKILGQQYDIVYKPMAEMAEELGICDSTRNIIYLRDGMNADKHREVLCHECLHGMAEMLNLGLSENKINALGVALSAFLKENDIQWK